MCKSQNVDLDSTCLKKTFYSFLLKIISSYISLVFNFYPENRGRGLGPERLDRIHKSEILLTGRINVGLKV